MRSFAAAALCFALIHSTQARVPHSFLEAREAEPEAQPEGWFSQFVGLVKRTLKARQEAATCYEDTYYTFVGDLGEGFCQDYMNYPNQTIPVYVTPTSTLTTFYTTDIDVETQYTQVTPTNAIVTTVTAGGAKAKRNAEPQITAGGSAGITEEEAFRMYRRQNDAAAANSTYNDTALRAAFSSACGCHDYAGSTILASYTVDPTVTTLRGFANSDTTTTQTNTVAAVLTTTTTTATAEPTSTSNAAPVNPPSQTDTTPADLPSQGGAAAATTVSATSAPQPTALSYNCPDDDNTTVHQMVGSELFAYTIMCDTVLMDSDVYNGSLSYDSFSECVVACSLANQRFDNPVCQGVSFNAREAPSRGDCFLKATANNAVMAMGVDSAMLQSIEFGLSNGTAQATLTENAPFAGVRPTQNPDQFSSMMASMLANSTNTMPMVAPNAGGPLVQSGRLQAPITAYSTYISDGSTFSSGTGYYFSTSFSNGSWYYQYYTEYSLNWASATTVYGATETGLAALNGTTTDTQKTNGANGEYAITTTTNTTTYFPEGYNVTMVITTITYEADGDEIASADTTSYFSYQTAVAGGGAGAGGSGLPASTAAGPVTSVVVNNNGSSNGGASGGGAGGPGSGDSTPVTSTSTFITQTVVSQAGGTGGASGGLGGGAAGFPVTQTAVSTIINSFGTAYSTYFIVSGGGPAGTGAANGGEGGGAAGSAPTSPSDVSPTILTVINTSGATTGGSGFAASGGPGNTVIASSGFGSEGPPSTPSPLTVIIDSGATGGASSFGASGGPGATGGASSFVGSGGPTTSSPLTASFTGDNRSGTYETAPSGTGSILPSTNETAPAPTGSSPSVSFTSNPRSGTIETSSSGTAPLYTGPGYSAPLGTAPGTAPAASSSGTYTAPEAPRSGTYETSPAGTAPAGTAPVGTAPPGTAPPGTAPVGTAPAASSPGTYTAPNDYRSGTYETFPTGTAPPGTAPVGTAPSGTAPVDTIPSGTAPVDTTPSGTAPQGTAPAGTSPGTYSAPEGSRYGIYEIPPSGTAPVGTGVSPSGASPYPAPSGSVPSGSLTVSSEASSGAPPLVVNTTLTVSSFVTGTTPPGTAPPATGLTGYPVLTGTSPANFSNTDVPRVPGTESSSMTDMFPSMTLPTAQTTCGNMTTMGTTTIFSTTTEYGCYSTCLPVGGWGGGYGEPQAFGPPVVTTGTVPPSPAEESATEAS